MAADDVVVGIGVAVIIGLVLAGIGFAVMVGVILAQKLLGG